MVTLANPYHALYALLYTRWQRHRGRHPAGRGL